MDIACPNCAAAYEIDDATVGSKGRKVRCAACGEVWRVLPAASTPPVEPGPETAALAPSATEASDSANAQSEPPAETKTETPAETAEPDPKPEFEVAPETVPAPPRRGARLVADKGKKSGKSSVWRRVANWRVATMAGTACVLAAGFLEREAVVRLLPQTAKLYAAVGFPVNLRGIEIRNVKSRLVVDGEESVLVVDGDLVNVAGRTVDVPRLHFSLTGADGRQIYVWSAQADRISLQPGETLNFRRRLAAPPTEAKSVSVRFVTRSDITAGIR